MDVFGERKPHARPISLALAHRSQGNVCSAGVDSQTVFSELSQIHHLPPYNGWWVGSTRRSLQRSEAGIPVSVIQFQ